MRPAPDSAVRHWPSVVLFMGVCVVVLTSDLVSKYMSFERVSDRPIELARSEEDGTTLVYERVESGELVLQPRYDPTAPASAIPPHEGRLVVPKGLRLKLMLNTGAVFGIGKNKQWFFALVSVVAVLIIGSIFYRSKRSSKWLHLCLGLILAGAIGNLYDRVRYNAVRDMFELFPDVDLPFGWSWPGGSTGLYPWIFNIADVALVVGVGMMLVIIWRHEAALKRAEKEQQQTSSGKPRSTAQTSPD